VTSEGTNCSKTVFAIAYYSQGGEFNPYITRGQIARIFLHLYAENLHRDAMAEVTINMQGTDQTKSTISVRNMA
jgi:hypothetical protein